MIKGKTKSGFAFSVSERVKEDYRLIQAYRKAKSADELQQVEAMSDMVQAIIGEKGEKALCEHLLKKEGCVPIDSLFRELGEIIDHASKSSKTIKN